MYIENCTLKMWTKAELTKCNVYYDYFLKQKYIYNYIHTWNKVLRLIAKNAKITYKNIQIKISWKFKFENPRA